MGMASAGEKKPLSTGKLVLILVVGIGTLFTLWMIVLVTWGAMAGKEIAQGMETIEDEAREVALDGPDACLDDALRRVDACPFWNFKCRVGVQMFQDRCLAHCEDTSEFCEDVPGPMDLLESVAHRKSVCAKHDQANEQGCEQIVQAAQMFCERTRNQ